MKKRKPKSSHAKHTHAGGGKDTTAQLLRQAVENSSDMISMADLKGNVIFANRAFLKAFGFSEREVLGQSILKLVSGNDPTAQHHEIPRVSREVGEWKGEWVSVRRDGTQFPVLLSLGLVKDEDGRPLGSFAIAQDITTRKLAEENLRRSEAQLRELLEESAKLTDLVDVFQACHSMEEAYRIAEKTLRAMLATRCGSLCVTSPSRNVLEAVASWGESLSTDKTFAPDQCWALRRGKIHIAENSGSALRCAHITDAVQSAHLCVPLAAHGETLGVLYLESPGKDSPGSLEKLAQQATAVGERISLALANLQLRETLRRQSIRDGLTGLFNRRYMEETFDRELSRALRNNHSTALLMFDIDHFKHFNDTFGHQAGDVLLRTLGDFLNQTTRGQDVPCRFGGEEFAVILTGASASAALQRAEILREEIGKLTVQHGGRVLGKISVSIGVSAFPDHGKTAEELVRAADAALYRAKTEGRDRVALVTP